MDTPYDVLQQTQEELEQVAEEVEELTGMDRREFVFRSLVVAAASTFGVHAARAQGGGGGGAAGAAGAAGRGNAQQTPPVALGNGEPPAMQFQAYPGGTGALIEKLAKERGYASFARATFTVEPWRGTVPTTDDDIAFLPAHRLSALIKERKITSARVTEAYLTRLKRLDPILLCAVTIMEAQARAEAARCDTEIRAGRYRGPLHGIPYGLKDLFATKGVRTTWGSKDFENRIIDEDSEVVVRLRDAGAVLMAKLATGQFASGANWYRGRTNNPWDIRRGASGSSTGPGSATAAACVAFSIGTETSGSIVSPSRENGISALRPTFGRVSRHGGMTLAWSNDRVGPMCRTIEDCAMVFNVIHGADEKDPSTITTPFHFDRNIRLAGLRIGVDAQAPESFVAKLRELGAKTVPIGPRPAQGGGGGGGGESAAAFDFYVQMKAKELGVDVATIEAAAGRGGGGRGGRGGRGGADSTAGRGAAPAGAAADSTGGRGGGGDSVTLPGLEGVRFPGIGGRTSRALDFIQGQRRRHILITRMGELLKDLDMYIPQEGGDVGLHSSTGHPSAVVQYAWGRPAAGGGGGGGGRGGRGGADSTAGGGRGGGGRAAADTTPAIIYNEKPICAQIIGNLFNDDLILSAAHQFQKNTDWHTKRPNI